MFRSSSFTSPCRSTNTFSGFTSLCTIPRSCAAARPSAISIPMWSARAIGSGDSTWQIRRSDWPSRSSMAIQTVPSGSVSALCTATMFLCRSRQSAMASLWARSRTCSELA